MTLATARASAVSPLEVDDVGYVVETVTLLARELPESVPLLAFAVCAAAMAVWRHRSNIRKLRDGTEHRFTPKSRKP